MGQRTREIRVANGQCAACGKKAHAKACKPQLDAAKREEKRRKARKDAGLCPRCGRPLEPGLESCLDCSFGESDAAGLRAGETDYVELMMGSSDELKLDPSKPGKARSIRKMSKAAGSST